LSCSAKYDGGWPASAGLAAPIPSPLFPWQDAQDGNARVASPSWYNFNRLIEIVLPVLNGMLA
jgi:hypothetical protein